MKTKNKAYVEINDSNIETQQATNHELSVDDQLELFAEILVDELLKSMDNEKK